MLNCISYIKMRGIMKIVYCFFCFFIVLNTLSHNRCVHMSRLRRKTVNVPHCFWTASLQMFLRNLKILSAMKWIICGLLLILSSLSCIFTGEGKSCQKNPDKHACIKNMMSKPQSQAGNGQGNNMEMDMFILGTDGFMGYMQTGDSNHTRSRKRF